MNEEGYPKHDEKFFAFKVIKALIQSGDNLVIGSNATSLVNLIAVAEDHFHYSRPIRFHRQQLMEQLGFRSGKQLDVARQKAADRGWLHFHKASYRGVTYYWSMIPEHARAIRSENGRNRSAIRSEDRSENGRNERAIRSENGTPLNSSNSPNKHCATSEKNRQGLLHRRKARQEAAK